MNFFQQDLKETSNSPGNSLIRLSKHLFGVVGTAEKIASEMNRRSEFDEDVIRKYLTLIDLEEFKIREKRLQGSVDPINEHGRSSTLLIFT